MEGPCKSPIKAYSTNQSHKVFDCCLSSLYLKLIPYICKMEILFTANIVKLEKASEQGFWNLQTWSSIIVPKSSRLPCCSHSILRYKHSTYNMLEFHGKVLGTIPQWLECIIILYFFNQTTEDQGFKISVRHLQWMAFTAKLCCSWDLIFKHLPDFRQGIRGSVPGKHGMKICISATGLKLLRACTS